MVTLYTFGPGFGLPDPSPFVMKAEILLKMAGLPFRTDTTGFRKAPKGKLPYIEDDGERIADSTPGAPAAETEAEPELAGNSGATAPAKQEVRAKKEVHGHV